MSQRGNRPALAVCRLCRKPKELQNSHLLPAALYKLMRAPGYATPNPIVVTEAVSVSTSQQVTMRLLCWECEQRLRQKGEEWVLRHCYRSKEGFLLREILERATPVWQGAKTRVVAAEGIPQLDIEQLVYFASSVFWRASVHRWKAQAVTVQIDLGAYEEGFRQYLLGDAEFSTNAAIHVSVSSSADPLLACRFPRRVRKTPYHRFNFIIPGVCFDLFVGKMMEPYIQRTCTLRSQGKLIFLSDHVDSKARSDILKALETSRPGGKLRSPNLPSNAPKPRRKGS